MWWPLTGKVHPDGTPRSGSDARPRIASDRFAFKAYPGDIAVFNRLALANAPYDITALSVRAWADVADRYAITAVGSSFGDGYGPKVVCQSDAAVASVERLRDPRVRIGVPGLKTSACMTMRLMLGETARDDASRLVEIPFDHILPAVVRGEVDAGLVIHEAQVTFAQVGLRQVVDLGQWWQQHRGLALPLGVNAVKRDLDERFGAGTVAEVSALLAQSLDYAMAHRDESVEYTMEFAALNAATSGTPAPTRELVERYIDMYVTDLTVDMGDAGRTAIRWLLDDGADAGLCPRVADVEPV